MSLTYGTNANTNIFELGEALKYSASTAMDLNVSLEVLFDEGIYE